MSCTCEQERPWAVMQKSQVASSALLQYGVHTPSWQVSWFWGQHTSSVLQVWACWRYSELAGLAHTPHLPAQLPCQP